MIAERIFEALVTAMREGRTPRAVIVGEAQLRELKQCRDRGGPVAERFTSVGPRGPRFGGMPVRVEGTLCGWRIESEHPARGELLFPRNANAGK